MPAKDKYHDLVKEIVEKEGWTVTGQYPLETEERSLWVDLHAKKQDGVRAILIEVKGFENMRSPVEYLESPVGQYSLYRAIIKESGKELPLYMAVPVAAYEGIFSEHLGRIAIEYIPLKLLVFNIATRKVVRWID